MMANSHDRATFIYDIGTNFRFSSQVNNLLSEIKGFWVLDFIFIAQAIEKIDSEYHQKWVFRKSETGTFTVAAYSQKEVMILGAKILDVSLSIDLLELTCIGKIVKLSTES